MGNRAPKFLVYQRRDNYEYIDILRGIWSSDSRLYELIDAISDDERERILTHTFKELWDDLWVVHGSHIHVDGFERAQRKFLASRGKIVGRCGEKRRTSLSTDREQSSREPPWGFPKGKKNDGHGAKESDRICALREFAEETRLPIDSIVLWPLGPISEYYKGNNNKPYCTHYFLAEAPDVLPIRKMATPGCIRADAVSEEAADARWVSYEEAAELLVPRRLSLLKKTSQLLAARYEEFSPLVSR
jgi:8-oxo-dGTP pyrophosphatase MutT (NUDIX family)